MKDKKSRLMCALKVVQIRPKEPLIRQSQNKIEENARIQPRSTVSMRSKRPAFLIRCTCFWNFFWSHSVALELLYYRKASSAGLSTIFRSNPFMIKPIRAWIVYDKTQLHSKCLWSDPIEHDAGMMLFRIRAVALEVVYDQTRAHSNPPLIRLKCAGELKKALYFQAQNGPICTGNRLIRTILSAQLSLGSTTNFSNAKKHQSLIRMEKKLFW